MQYFGSKISDNITKREPEGYLYCLNVPIARTGKQKYLANEVGMDGNSVVDVVRTPDEVFKASAIASFEGMPITRDHPDEEVDVRNIGAYQRGHVQNVRRGLGKESDCVIADLVITHESLIHDVMENKIRDVSCGYEVEYKQADDGKVYQVGIRGNHVAIVDSGRAGERVAIRDKAIPKGTKKDETQGRGIETMSKKGSMFARMFASFAKDESVLPEEVIEAADELFSENEEEEVKEAKKPVFDKRGRDGFPPIKPEMEKEEKRPFPATDEGSDEMLQLVSELAAEVKALKELVLTKPRQDGELKGTPGKKPLPEKSSLDELEEEVAGEKAPSEPLNASSVTIPPEDIEVEDEEPEEEEFPPSDITEEEEAEDEETSTDTTTQEIVKAAINELKPIIAGMPAADRKRAADAASRAIRKAAGMDETPSRESKQKLANAAGRKKIVKDSDVDGRKLGEEIMRKRNPHYMK